MIFNRHKVDQTVALYLISRNQDNSALAAISVKRFSLDFVLMYLLCVVVWQQLKGGD